MMMIVSADYYYNPYMYYTMYILFVYVDLLHFVSHVICILRQVRLF